MANTPVSPKVKSAGAIGSVVGILLAYAAAVTPETFAFLGKWAQPAYLAVTLGSAVFAAWRTADPLRDAGAAATAPLTPGSVPVVDAPAVSPSTLSPAFTFPASAVAATEATPEITAPDVVPSV